MGGGELDQISLELNNNDVIKATDVSECHLKKLRTALAPVCASLRKVHTRTINLQWKIKKRTRPPQEALDKCQDLRDLIDAIWKAAFAVCATPIDGLKLHMMLSDLETKMSWPAPLQFAAWAYKRSAEEHMVGGNAKEFAELIDCSCSASPIAPELRANINMQVIEFGVLKPGVENDLIIWIRSGLVWAI